MDVEGEEIEFEVTLIRSFEGFNQFQEGVSIRVVRISCMSLFYITI